MELTDDPGDYHHPCANKPLIRKCVFFVVIVHLGHLKNDTYPYRMNKFLLRNLKHAAKLILIVLARIHSLNHSTIA